MKKRIETRTSRTAQWTCVSRAASSLESRAHYKSDDTLAVLLVPTFLSLVLKISTVRKLYGKVMAPKGIYEYVIVRTKYIDKIFQEALAEQFDQILLFGAGFDTRAVRFQAESKGVKIFELDVPRTQAAKLAQYQRRKVPIPLNIVFVGIDFEKESLPQKLDAVGFEKDQRSLFVLEGLLMYLNPSSVDETFRIITEYAGQGSRVVFDYIYASVLRREHLYYGEEEVFRSVTRANEQWHFGIEEGEIAHFLSQYGLMVHDHMNAEKLEENYFKNSEGKVVGKINGTHCLVTAEVTLQDSYNARG